MVTSSTQHGSQAQHLRPRPLGGRTSEYESVATEDTVAGIPARKVVDVRLPKEASLWQCGEQRLKLRRKFNLKEIDAAKIISKYGAGNSKVLEPAELRQLLQDYNRGKHLRDDELEYIMKVTDRRNDECISQEEVLFALRAWYAFNNMPKSVGAAFTKYRVGDGPIPSGDDLHSFLVALNESLPVNNDEVEFVRNTALGLGASEGLATLEQMRQAIAAWYIHIEREETDRTELLKQSAQNAHEQILGITALRKMFNGQCDQKEMGHLVLIAVMATIFLILPCIEIFVAKIVPNSEECEHPGLSNFLRSTGILGLVQVISTISAFAASRYKADTYRIFAWTFAGTVSVILVIAVIIGSSHVMTSTAARCGLFLWHFCNFAYVTVPILIVAFACCGFPCLYCWLGGVEFVRNQSVDESLLQP